MSTTASIEARLSRHSKDTGIPKKDLKKMVQLAGLELLDTGKLVIKAKPKRRKPAAK